MTGDENKAAVRRFFQNLDRQDWEAAMDVFADDYRLHMSGNPQPMTAQEFAGFGQMFFAAMPDLTHTVDALVAEGDEVACRLIVAGTHEGELMGVPPTGRAVQVDSFNFYRFRDGKIVEQWVNFDAMSLMQQIGAVPVPA
jgi:steroid delta-isomerase-like uncharacterized protein